MSPLRSEQSTRPQHGHGTQHGPPTPTPATPTHRLIALLAQLGDLLNLALLVGVALLELLRLHLLGALLGLARLAPEGERGGGGREEERVRVGCVADW